MAQAIAAGIDARGERSGTIYRSAGVAAHDGDTYSYETLSAVERLGFAPPRGSSNALTPAMIREANAIYAMTRAHRSAVLALGGQSPEVAAKTQLLDPEGRDVPDPVGSSQARYDLVARDLERMIRARLQEPNA